MLAGLLRGDGNMLERVMSQAPLTVAGPTLDSLRAQIPSVLNKRYHRHYRGFATNQRRRLLQEPPTAKRLLYVLRTSLTGAHLLREGVCEPNLMLLWERYGFDEVPELVVLKRGREQGLLDASWRARLDGLLARADRALDDALQVSLLPEQPDRAQLESWLIEVRRRDLLGRAWRGSPRPSRRAT